ncbi:thioesterase domain-containing protein [Gracilibacillus saliphilus]|uniref:thioesterase domain-containing protein n=1 Tax=Gracilibacillus saliphilus TaxID=543890 RepID=UPI0013D713C2|nr:thioesterase domain-containing protein [Gracilibacillus saliphilus]
MIKFHDGAGVSSFGFGGVNAHIILEEYEETPETIETETSNQLIVLSARNEERLVEYAQQFIDFIEKETMNQKQSSLSKDSFQSELTDIIAKIMNVSPQDIDPFEEFEDYGFGNVQWNRLFTELYAKYEMDLQPAMTMQNYYKTISELADYLQSTFGIGGQSDTNKNHYDMGKRWACTLQMGREEMDTRIACVAATPQELTAMLKDFVRGGDSINGLYQGRVVSASGLDEQTVNQEEEIEQLLQTEDLHQLARKWINGVQINWERLLYANQVIQRVSLPTYPFAKERYWAPKSQPKKDRIQTEQSLMNRTNLELAVTSIEGEETETNKDLNREQIIQMLKEILAEKLKLDPTEIEEDVELSEYGVDSMLSSVIIQVVEERFGEQMDANVIVEYPTISALGDYILEEMKPLDIESTRVSSKPKVRKPKYPPELIPINTKGNKQISFWFHGATGYSTVFRNLSRILGPDYPMYAFQARGMGGKTMPHLFDEMVDHYYNCVRMIQPNGPYFFGGYSFGGLVAMEIARRLKAEGEEILHLIMFATYPPTEEVNELFYGTYDFDFLKLFLVNAFLKSDENPELLITNEDIKDVPRRLQTSYLAKLAKEKSGTLIETDEICNFIRGGMLVSDYAEEAYATHKPDSYDVSNVTFFKTTKGFVSDDNPLGLLGVNILDGYDYSTYWNNMVKKDLDVFTVECDHNGILEEPILSEVAPKVLRLLESCSSMSETKKSKETAPVQDATLLLQTFQDMDVFQEAGKIYNKQELLEKLELSPVYSSLFNSWIEILELEGYIRMENGKIPTTEVIESL